MSEVELLRTAVWVLCAIATTIGGSLIALVIWNFKQVLEAIASLRKEVTGFERRITRLENRAHWRLHHGGAAAGGDD
jgi:hypothetical protein